MQYFHEEKILSTYNTKAAKKRRENLAKTENLLESFDSLRETDDIIEKRKEKALRENFYSTINTSHKMNKKDTYEINQKNQYINEQIDNLCRDLFFFTVYESLLVDDVIKNANYRYIREHCNEFYDLCKENDMISIKENSGFDDIFQTGIAMLKEELIDNNSCDLGRVIENTINEESFLTQFMIESIKAKTANSVRNEKQASIIKEELINEEKYVDPTKSLFRYLFENNIQETIEQTEITDPENLQDFAMLETILDYTILETANTAQLVEFRNIKSICNSV